VENEVVIHVRAEDDTAAGFAKAKDAAKKLGEQIERSLKAAGKRAGRALADGIHDGLKAHHQALVHEADSIGDDVERELRESGDRAGDGLGRGVSDGFGLHAADIPVIAGRVGDDVADEMERAGRDAGEKLGQGISDGLKAGTEGAAGGGDDEDGIIPGAGKKGRESGRKAGMGFVEALGTVLADTASNPRVLGALALVGVAAAPLIGGVLGAAVVGGAAGVGIVGGFTAAVQHPQVKGAGAALGNLIKEDLKSATTSFVPAAVGAIDSVATRWKALLPEIKSIFNNGAGLLDPLLDGVLDGVDALVYGISDAIGGAGPVVEAFGDMFAEVGAELADLLSRASNDSASWASALDFLTEALTTVIGMVSVFLEVAASMIQAFQPIGDVIGEGINWLDEWAVSLGIGATATSETADAQEGLTGKVETTTDSIQSQIEWMAALSDEMKKQTDPLFNLISAQQDVTSAQKDYNDALKKHGPKSEEAKDALVKLGKAATNMSGAAASAAKDGLGVVTPAMRDMWRQAGLSKTQIAALEGALKAAKRAANNWEGTFTQTYIVQPKGQNTIGGTGYSGLAHGGIAGAANGSMSSGMTMVGEAGPELVKLPAGTQVYSSPDTRRKLAESSPTGAQSPAGMQAFIRFDPSGTTKLIRAIMESLRAEIRSEGGNVQTVLGVG
jgi:hypothetical protein